MANEGKNVDEAKVGFLKELFKPQFCRNKAPSLKDSKCQKCDTYDQCFKLLDDRKKVIRECRIKFNLGEKIDVKCYSCPGRFICSAYKELG